MKRIVVAVMICIGFCGAMFTNSQAYAACTAITAVPTTLSTSDKTYCLTGNLASAVTGTAIAINADNIVIDLAGWELRNTNTGHGRGIGFTGTHKNITIKNGNITGFNTAVRLDDENGRLLTNILVDGINADHSDEAMTTDSQGIRVDGDQIVIRNCKVNSHNTGNNSITSTGTGIYIYNNDVFNPATNNGIYCGGSNSVVENNRISATTLQSGTGIYADQNNVLILGNRIMNTTTGIDGSSSACKYRDNITVNCGTAYTGNCYDAGNNK
jgi:hypothetical protein